MRRTLVLDVAGLSASFLGDRMPNLTALARRGGSRLIRPVFPALSSTMQATFITGVSPRHHGVVGNGWYFRDLAEINFNRASSALVEGEKIWDTARRRDPTFTSAQLFWSHAMYSTADFSVVPRPIERADGRTIPDVHAQPACLRWELKKQLGDPPLPAFWGPSANIASSKWIVRSALHVMRTRRPTLLLVRVPHLEIALQRLGPDHPDLGLELEAIDDVCGELIAEADRDGARVVVLSEFAATPVSGPVHINRALRKAQLLAVREEAGREVLDPGASDAFAVADHQVAHIYVRRAEQIEGVKKLLEALPGVETVWDREMMRAHGLDHARSGELFAIAAHDRWFTYYHWQDDAHAPDLARTVSDKKPGHDPAELFVDPQFVFPQVALKWRAIKRALGFRSLHDIVPIHASLVRGSFGRVSADVSETPVMITTDPDLVPEPVVEATQVKQVLLDHIFGAVKKPSHLVLLNGTTDGVRVEARESRVES
jgi:predicted AlkP superfamily pyrophosphatase or phosphodiesterase